jgi:K+-transporting ATPase ATPase C chain
MVKEMLTNLRFIFGTLLLCAVLYPAFLFCAAQAFVPARAEGSLIHDRSGRVIGSRLIAQEFTRAEYLRPRPSAVDFNAAAAGGSNLSASNASLVERAEMSVAHLTGTGDGRIPGELIAASGSGLDPHITLQGAVYQADRIARARGVSAQRVKEVVRHEASAGTPWSPRLVNVLEANLALDQNLGSLSPR